MLIVFGGLPGTGKTTISRAFAKEIHAVYLRIDTIEQALRSSKAMSDVGPAGYVVAYALASSNLGLGQAVVADSVNPMAITRDAWKDVAINANASFFEVEIVCSDKAEHRRRVETRAVDIPELKLPTWEEVATAKYETWKRPHLMLDTSRLAPEEALEELRQYLKHHGPQ